jgi:hypothetical protein
MKEIPFEESKGIMLEMLRDIDTFSEKKIFVTR